MPQVFRHDARNIVTALLNKAWDRLAQSRGLLLPREFVVGDAWFVPLGICSTTTVSFSTMTMAEAHWRQLAGHSEARRVYWHFSVSARATIAEPCYLALRSHVVFSEDGQTPIEGRRAGAIEKELLQEAGGIRDGVTCSVHL